MKLIAHRGNIDGPNMNEENKPEYILQAIEKGYFVEIDLWYKDNTLYLGHDSPQYEIEYSFFIVNKYKLFIHCKNIQALQYILNKNDDLECFFHDNDECVLTSKGNIWTYPGKLLTKKSICVMPERAENINNNLSECVGICSDYISKYAHLDNYIFVSLGFDCTVATILQDKGLCIHSYPFDFCITPDITSIFENRFENFFNISQEHTNYFLKNSKNANVNLNAKFNNYGVGFLHHNIEEDKCLSDYKKKIDKIKNLLVSEKKVIFLRTCKKEQHKYDVLNFNDDIEDMTNFNNFLQKTYPNLDYEILLFINNGNKEYNGLFTKTLKIYNVDKEYTRIGDGGCISKHNLENTIINTLARYKYENMYGEPEVKNEIDTINDIITNKKSIIRFGDGELKLVRDENCSLDLGFAKNSNRMRNTLIEILNNDDEVYVAILNIYKGNIHKLRCIEDRNDNDWYLSFLERHYECLKYYKPSKQYYSAFIFRPQFPIGLLNEEYINLFKKIWENKKICIINNNEYIKYESIFNNVVDCKFIKCKERNALDDDELIMNQSLQLDKDVLFIIMAGPAAKIWCWELTKKGYQCIDCGNIETWCKEFNIYEMSRINYNNLIVDPYFKEYFTCYNHILYCNKYIRVNFCKDECILETYSNNEEIEKNIFNSNGIHFKLNNNYKTNGLHKLSFEVKGLNELSIGKILKFYTGNKWITLNNEINNNFQKIEIIEHFENTSKSKYRISFNKDIIGLRICIKNLELIHKSDIIDA